MANNNNRLRFERIMLVHLDAAYNLALWLLRDPADAEDIVQTAYAKAFEHFPSYHEGNAAGWILTIVRNTAYNYMSNRKRHSNLISFDEAVHGSEEATQSALHHRNPEQTYSAVATGAQVLEAIDRIPVEFREVLFLREIEGCSYKEISEITQVAQGTVMSRLSRARAQLQNLLAEQHSRKKSNVL